MYIGGNTCLAECTTSMEHSISGLGHGLGNIRAWECVWEESHDYARSDCDGGSDRCD